MTRNIHGPLRLAAALAAGTALLAGCGGGGYTLTTPPFAGSPACSTLTGQLPDRLGGFALERSDVTGAAAWGDGDVIVYCGMPESEAGGDCFDEGGVDWVAQPPTDDRTVKMFSTRGRDPGVQVRLRNETTDASAVLSALGPAVKSIESRESCAAAES
ncbi:DUF3515 family protein [Streptomyces cyaneofuscatus]|uniref:DUF3515 family protein n=1 Tax=Streptomyces cyaneofuscatus TaxID=66883 RepID=UPI00365783D0